MELKNGMKVIAPNGCEDYLTEGKEYEVYNVEIYNGYGYHFKFIADNGIELFSIFRQSSHLNGKDWIIKKEMKEAEIKARELVEEFKKTKM